MHKRLEGAIYKLLQEERFYANFILNCRIYFDKFDVPTAGVCVVNGVPTMVFNSKFLEEKCPTIDNMVALLKHEVLHLVLDHLDNMKEEPILWNIAMDCMINQEISKGLPEGAVTLSGLEKMVGESLQAKQTSAYYYEYLKKKKDEILASGADSMDDHNMQDKIPGSSKSYAEKKAAIANATSKAVKASAGDVPDSIRKALGELMGDAQVPWQDILSNFVARATSTTRQLTRKKPNRRFELDAPGVKKKQELILGVCVDSSGSVSDDMFAALMTEVKHLVPHTAKTYLIQADCVVHKVDELSKNVEVPLERAGNGGTAYQPAITACLERDCDAIIYMGDGDCADTPEDPEVPFLWVFVGKSKPPGDFGHVIYIDHK